MIKLEISQLIKMVVAQLDMYYIIPVSKRHCKLITIE